MATRVKICGITRVEDARLAVELGAAALGFNFYRPSPRFIEPSDAGGIIGQLPPLVVTVGVFANETDGAQVVQVARLAGVSAIQLHGPKFPAPEGELENFRVIHAVAVREDSNPPDWGVLRASALLLDAYDPELHGGTGRNFDWDLAREAKKYGAIILAGGLTSENVGRAIREVRPYAVDVASGVESAPGIKDAAKLRAFFATVEEADRNLKGY
jgi:phosphoribosylanthranilate isomerase